MGRPCNLVFGTLDADGPAVAAVPHAVPAGADHARGHRALVRRERGAVRRGHRPDGRGRRSGPRRLRPGALGRHRRLPARSPGQAGVPPLRLRSAPPGLSLRYPHALSNVTLAASKRTYGTATRVTKVKDASPTRPVTSQQPAPGNVMAEGVNPVEPEAGFWVPVRGGPAPSSRRPVISTTPTTPVARHQGHFTSTAPSGVIHSGYAITVPSGHRSVPSVPFPRWTVSVSPAGGSPWLGSVTSQARVLGRGDCGAEGVGAASPAFARAARPRPCTRFTFLRADGQPEPGSCRSRASSARRRRVPRPRRQLAVDLVHEVHAFDVCASLQVRNVQPVHARAEIVQQMHAIDRLGSGAVAATTRARPEDQPSASAPRCSVSRRFSR